MAWRNLWRNTRRTILTILAITFALGLTVFTRGLQFGTYAQTIDYNVRLGIGHLQLQHADYWDEQTLGNTCVVTSEKLGRLEALPGVTAVSPKLATEALVAIGEDASSGARLEGVVPSREALLSKVPQDMVDGAWLTDEDSHGAVLGAVLARNLGAAVGDTLVYFTQGRHGATAAGLYTVRGVFATGDQGLDAFVVYLPLNVLQDQLWADDRLTSVNVRLVDAHHMDEAAAAVREQLVEGPLAVLTYRELIPDIMSSIAFDKASGAVFLILLLIIAGFGILETILMSVMERFHEFGVMGAVGMHRRSIAGLILLEAGFVGLVGAVAGNVVGLAANLWLRRYPITLESLGEMYQEYGFAPELAALVDLGDQALWSAVVLAMTLTVAVWPAVVAARFRPVDAIRMG